MRDTDTDWEVIASTQAFFGVLANEEYLAHNLTPERKDAFYETGRGDIEHVAAMLHKVSDGAFAPRSALDFGCGVGRLTFAMRKYAAVVTGVDSAEGMLDVARAEQLARGLTGIEWRRDLPPGPVDWVNSLIVMQHIPPERGHDLLEQLADLLAPGGFWSVQLTFYRDPSHTTDIVRDLADYRYDGKTIELLSVQRSDAGAMTMYDYDLNRVLRMLYRSGIDIVTAQHTNHGGCHGAWLFAHKPS
jgi:trans-aconitate methyltransferase